MKKIFILLMLTMVITGCGGKNDNVNESNSNNQTEENNHENKDNDEAGSEGKDVYQIGETAQIISAQGSYPYEITVNDFKLTKEIDGKSLEDFYVSGSPSEDERIAVVNVTLKNSGDESFVPNNIMPVMLLGDFTREKSFDQDFFTERNEEVNPGEEITGNLVFVGANLLDEEAVYLNYEGFSEAETEFELPIPEE